MGDVVKLPIRSVDQVIVGARVSCNAEAFKRTIIRVPKDFEQRLSTQLSNNCIQLILGQVELNRDMVADRTSILRWKLAEQVPT